MCNRACDLAASNLRAHKKFYLKKTVWHCAHCKRDTMRKKLLTLIYFDHHLRNLFKKPTWTRPSPTRVNTNIAMSSGFMGGPEVEMDSDSDAVSGLELELDSDSDDTLVGDDDGLDFLDSPILKDLDDFENEDDDDDTEDSLILAQVDADGDVKMKEVSAF
jgi:hypothetical protein